MNLLDYFLLAGILGVIIWILVHMAREKKQKKTGCAHCAYRENCVNKPANLNDATGHGHGAFPGPAP